VVAFTEVHNTRSRAVMERLGMTYVREIRRPGLVAGRPGVHADARHALYVADLRKIPVGEGPAGPGG
ncbi:MAG: GNAT family N-acetyltransferase, partial [Actinomycetes bacterium]